MNFSENLKFLRKEFNFTARELSQKLNCSTNLIYDWEHSRCEPSFSVLCLLSDIFNCSIDYLLGREDELGNLISSNNFNPHTEDEEKLLSAFRQLDDYDKESLLIQTIALSNQKPLLKK